MNTIKQFLLLLIAMLGFLAAQAQKADVQDTKHGIHEIGIANSLVYFVDNADINYGFHAHYVYNIPNSFFGLGLSYERIFSDEPLNSIGMVLDLRLIERIHFTLSPGLSSAGNGFDALEPSFHIETSYEFDFGLINLGPMLEFAFENDDFHISLGLHFGFGF